MRTRLIANLATAAILASACVTPPAATTRPTGTASAIHSAPASPASPSPGPTRVVHDGLAPVETGVPIRLADLAGRILFDDFENLYAMNVDGSDVVTIAGRAGAEFDGAWSPDGRWVVYRDSTRGINVDDEVFIARAEGSQARNLTHNPANDWGPDWSPDGSTIVFSSDRDGAGHLTGWLVAPDGSNLRKLAVDGWVEYPSFSPDGSRIVYESAIGNNYEIVVADVAGGTTTRLTTAPGGDAWPVWSPDGRTIAFTSERDDCAFAPPDADCWSTGEPGEHRSVYLVDPDGANLRRVPTEHGQFVAWSPDGAYLLVSGRSLRVIRPDGTGRLELRAEGFALPLGGIPDWR